MVVLDGSPILAFLRASETAAARQGPGTSGRPLRRSSCRRSCKLLEGFETKDMFHRGPRIYSMLDGDSTLAD